MKLYPCRELTTTSKVQECCGLEFAAKLGEFDYRRVHTSAKEYCTSEGLRSLDDFQNSIGTLFAKYPYLVKYLSRYKREMLGSIPGRDSYLRQVSLH